jgi:hypothetical protein
LVDVTVPCNALVLVTANNASIRADMLRRTLPVRIVVDTEEPERRRFTFDSYQEARRNRLALIAAGLTIAKAWWAARETATNEQDKLIRETTLGSFEQWAELVAGAIEWLTGMNPVTLIEERKTEDPRRGDERAVIKALANWQATRPGGPWWPAKEAINAIGADLWANVVQTKGEQPSSKQIGRWLMARRDRVFADLQLTGHPDRKDVMEWTIRPLPALPAYAGLATNQPCECVRDENGENKIPDSQKAGESRQSRQPGGPLEPDDEEFEL